MAEIEKPLHIILAELQMNTELYLEFLKDISHMIMTSVYPEAEAALDRVFHTDFPLFKTLERKDQAKDVDRNTEKMARTFYDTLVGLETLEAIKEYCSSNNLANALPSNETIKEYAVDYLEKLNHQRKN